MFNFCNYCQKFTISSPYIKRRNNNAAHNNIGNVTDQHERNQIPCVILSLSPIQISLPAPIIDRPPFNLAYKTYHSIQESIRSNPKPRCPKSNSSTLDYRFSFKSGAKEGDSCFLNLYPISIESIFILQTS